MPITAFLAGRKFHPEQITVMSAAFADTCKALGLETDHALMPLVAQHVMGLSQRGVKSRTVLYLLTLEEFRSYRQMKSLRDKRRRNNEKDRKFLLRKAKDWTKLALKKEREIRASARAAA